MIFDCPARVKRAITKFVPTWASHWKNRCGEAWIFVSKKDGERTLATVYGQDYSWKPVVLSADIDSDMMLLPKFVLAAEEVAWLVSCWSAVLAVEPKKVHEILISQACRRTELGSGPTHEIRFLMQNWREGFVCCDDLHPEEKAALRGAYSAGLLRRVLDNP